MFSFSSKKLKNDENFFYKKAKKIDANHTFQKVLKLVFRLLLKRGEIMGGSHFDLRNHFRHVSRPPVSLDLFINKTHFWTISKKSYKLSENYPLTEYLEVKKGASYFAPIWELQKMSLLPPKGGSRETLSQKVEMFWDMFWTFRDVFGGFA